MTPTATEQTSRQYRFSELLGYSSGWALLAACFHVDHDTIVLSTIALCGLLILPGPLVGGALGFVLGGRRWFLPSALCGTSGWILFHLMLVILAG